MVTFICEAAIQMGHGEEVLKEIKRYDVSIRKIARALAARKEADRVRKWIDGFDEADRQAGGRCFALLGLAEGYASSVK